MARERPTAPAAPGKQGRARFCLSSCLGLILVLAVGFLIAYGVTGRYQPNIPPPPRPPSPNGFEDYLDAAIIFEVNGGDKPMYGPNGQPDLLNQQSVVRANQPALARFREGTTRECMVPYEASFDARFEYLGKMRSLARLLAAESEVYRAGGNPGRAASSALDAIQLGTDIERGGLLLHGLTGTAIQAIGQAQLIQTIDQLDGKAADAAMARLQKIILRRVPPDAVMDIESRYLLTSLSKTKDVATWDPNTGTEQRSGWRKGFDTVAWHFGRDRALRDLERYMSQVTNAAGKPASERRNPPVPGGYAGMLAPVFIQAIDKLNAVDLRNRLMLIEIGIRRYRLHHGVLPKSLGDLGLNPKVVIDPESGKPIVYKRRDRDYLLYGVGTDGRDDGGIPADESQQQPRGDFGIRMFMLPGKGSTPGRNYRLVPHMLPPVVPPGSPPLKD